MKKYERFEKRTSTLSAHLETVGDIEVGDSVRVMNTSSFKGSFCVIEKTGGES